MQLVAPRLFSAEAYLAIASLALAPTVYQILESDLLRSPSVRKYSVLGYIALKELSQAKIAIVVILQQTHYSTRFEDRKREGSR
jgi:hypothetical protein